MDKAKIMELVGKNLNVPGLLADVMSDILDPALQKLVDDSSNPYDDMAKAALYPLLEEALQSEMQKLWDKLLEEDEVQS